MKKNFIMAMFFAGCSVGPQTPISTTPINVSCTWNLQDGGVAEDCDCMIDRSTGETASENTGNRVRDVAATVESDVEVPAQ